MDRWFQHGERGERGRHSEREGDRERERKRLPRAAQSGGVARGFESPEGVGRRRGQGNSPHGSLKTGNGLDGSAARSARANKCPSQDKVCASDPKRASHGMPMKMLIREEMSKEKESRRTSPNIIARLMGLESLPTPVTKQINLSDKGAQKTSYASLKENRSGEDKFSKVQTPEQQEFKDVFEVFDAPKVEKCKDPLVRKKSLKVKRSNKDIDFIRQKFMEAKRLSTDEKLRCSREFGDALEVLDSNKDIFLKFLQEPNSLLAKQCHDLNSTSSSPHSGHITILKSTKSMNLEDGEIGWKSCGGEFRSNEYQRDVANLGPKLKPDANNSCASKQCVHISNKLEDINFESDLEPCTVPTRIVVLKPCLEKVQSADDSASDPFLGYRRHNECISRSKKMSFDIDDSQKMQIDIDLSRHKTKSAREKTREFEETRVTKMERNNCVSASDFGEGEFFQIDDVGRTRRQGKRTVVDVEAMKYNSGCSYSRERKLPSSPAQSDKYLVSKQARKHLSKQWLVSQNSHEDVTLANSGMSTLGEMLAFSDKETHDCGSSRCFNHKGGTSPTPSVTSTDSQRHVCSRKLPRSRSLPTSSTVCKSLRSKNSARVCDEEDSLSLGDVLTLARKSSDGDSFPRFSPPKTTAIDVGNRSCSLNYKREQNHIHVRETSTQSHEQWNRMVTIENSHEVSELSSARFFDAVASDDDAPRSDSEDEEATSTLKLDILRAGEAPDINCHTSDNLQWSQELSPSNSRIEHSISESSSGYAELSTASKEAEQASPVSVLDPPEDEETSSLDCFERVNADLRGLRIQLQRLRLERANTYSDGSDLLSDDETSDVPDVPPLHVEDAPLMCDDEEKRSISYLNDILSNSGLTGATMEMLFDACYSSEFPLNPSVFDKHEKVYTNPATWSRHERKLLFDLVNLYLKEKLEPHMDQRLWLQPIRKVGLLNGELVPEEMWKSLVGLKEWKGHPMESAVDIRWLDVRDDIDSIGKDLEKMLRDELLDEFIQELVSGLPVCVL